MVRCQDMEPSMKILFSGRFDPPHPGHIASILRLEKKGHVTVVVLDYSDREYPIEYVKTVFNEIFERHGVEIITNSVHFGKVDVDELKNFGCDVYAGGNLTVLRHIEQLGHPVMFCDRAFEYSSRNIKRVLD